jgi:hypothetical protein
VATWSHTRSSVKYNCLAINIFLIVILLRRKRIQELQERPSHNFKSVPARLFAETPIATSDVIFLLITNSSRNQA